MDTDLFDQLEGRIVSLMNVVQELKLENDRLKGENDRLVDERGNLKARIDSILRKLEGV